MDGSSAGSISEIDVLADDVSVRLLCRHFESWGLLDPERARAAAGRVLAASQRLARDGFGVDPVELATQWIRAVAEHRDGSDWFFRARSLLARFPGTFLETELPAHHECAEVELVPRQAPRAMPEQDIAGPVARVVRVARSALEEALPAMGVEPTVE